LRGLEGAAESAGAAVAAAVHVSELACNGTVEGVQLLGGNGYMKEYGQEKRMRDARQARTLFERVEDEIGTVPGVTGIAASMVPLLADSSWSNDVSVEGFPAGPDTDTNASLNEIGPGYFRTLGIRLLSGREFTRADALGTPKVAIVNEAFAKKFNLGRQAVGKHMRPGRGTPLDIEIVGLVQNAKYSNARSCGSSSEAMEAPFCRAVRSTLVGTITPNLIMSPYSRRSTS
jgi:hypothetical protein